ncbi:MAG: tetratricopeptide repeat protein [Promethearchaeota archaeon]
MSAEPDANSLFEVGREYYSKKAYKEALKAWKAALEQYQKEGKKRESGIVSAEIGKTLLALGQKKEALVSCTQAVRILREVNDPPVLRAALLVMGHVMDELGYVEESNRAFIQAVEIPEGVEDTRFQINLLIRIGNSLARVGNYRDSANRFEEAIRLSSKVEDVELRGETLAGYARILQYLDEHDQAEEILTQLIRLWDASSKPELSAYAYLGLASSYLSEGYQDKAYATIQQAQSLFTSTSDQTGMALSEYHQARLFLQSGKPEEALAHGERALKHFEKEKNYLAYAETAIIVAQILGRLVQDVRALRLFDKAIEFFIHLKEVAREKQTHVLKGKALLRIGKRNQAEQEFTQAIRYYQEHNRTDREALVYIEVGEMFFELSQYAEALAQSKLALTLLQTLNEEKLEIRGFRLLQDTVKKTHLIEEELPFIQEGVGRAESQGKAVLASTLRVITAQLSLEKQPPEQLKAVFEKAIHDEQLPTALRAEAAVSLGLILMKTADYSEAAQYLSQAIRDFGEVPGFEVGKAYLQLAESYKELGKPSLQREALQGAIEALGPQGDNRTKAKLLFELAPLIEAEDPVKALEYYEKSSEIFRDGEYLQEYYQALLRQASLLGETSDFESASQIISKTIALGKELDIPLKFEADMLPLPWEHVNAALAEAIFIGAHQYTKHQEQTIIDQIIDWSGPRKVAYIHPFLTSNLGYERCSELSKLLTEEAKLLKRASDIRRELRQLLPRGIPEVEYQSRRNALHSELSEIFEQIEVNRNVIAAACPDPGRGMIPQDYKMLQKLSALMPPDRRWLIINFDLLLEKQKLFVTTLDHVGRHNLHTIPISADLPSVIQSLQAMKTSKEFPSMADLKDMASFLYRSLIPTRLERELENNKYGFLQFVTDGFLNNVPFELIFDGKEYWGLKYPMAWVPDFQFFESTLKTKALAQASSSSVLLGVNVDSEQQPSRKEFAEEIANSFLAAVPTRQGVSEPVVLFGRDFTRSLLKVNIDSPRSLLYFSTPTTLHPRKGEIALQHPDTLRVIEIGVTTNFKGAPILILDDCVRPEPTEDGLELAGFLRHLVSAGSPSIVFTRWRPEEQLQAVFTQGIVRQLFEGDPIGVALMHTRRRLASRGPSPHSWLCYSLCGNPFPTLF